MEFTLFWLNGRSEVVAGPTPEDAMNGAGIGAGALRALDFWTRGDCRDDYWWDADRRSWRAVP